MSIILIDARSDSLTVTWPTIAGAEYYIMEFKQGWDSEFEFLADDLVQPQARKRNLSPGFEYFFRAAPIFANGRTGQWMIHREPFRVLDYDEEEYCMAPPLTKIATNGSLIISWEYVEEAFFYELQMRENRGGSAWQTVADEVQGTEVKKKNLTSTYGYQFRVRPVTEEEEPWSAPSIPAIAVNGQKTYTNNNTNNNTRQSQTRSSYNANNNNNNANTNNYNSTNNPSAAQRDPNQMAAPWIKNAGIKNAVLICWQKVEGAHGYEIQMIENSGGNAQWQTIASNLSGTEVRKKNLFSTFGYRFRVRPNGLGGNRPFSPPSPIAIAT